MQLLIDFIEPSDSKTNCDFSLFFCLSPTVILGLKYKGASIIPLDEFPIKNDDFFNKDK